MFTKTLFLALVFGLSAHFAWASFDNSCAPHWSLNQGGYDRCSSLPVLAPGNDTRVNLKLLLVDGGFATLQSKPVSKEDAEFGYGKVPFSLETFENSIFLSRNDTDSSNKQDESAGYGGGTRCVSNDTGKEDFIEALDHSKDISKAERQFLTGERQKLNPACIDAPVTNNSSKINSSKISGKNLSSPTSRQFMQYLAAATAFYEGRYDKAGSDFSGLIHSENSWIKESSCYMLGRTELNLAQQNAFDSYGYPELDKVDRKALLVAEADFNNYLKEYPGGRYASSARGLLRRVYWLSKQPEKLAAEFDWLLNHPDSPQHDISLYELVLEADNKLLATAAPMQIKNPLLLATLDLSLMRPSDSSGAKQISFADLRNQQSLFADHKALYEYLLAAHSFYVQKDAANTLKALSDKIPAKMTYLDFSRLVLRGLALEATKDRIGARKLWLSLLPVARQPLQNETLQLALALNYEYGNEPESAFKPNSPITDAAIRNILIRNAASADLLRRIIKTKNNSSEEHHLAIYTLLYKDLLQGHYQDYIRDYPFLPGDAAKYKLSPGMDYSDKPQLALFTWSGKKSSDSCGCPSTLEIAGILAKNAKDPYGLNCLGDFVNTNELDSGSFRERFSSPHSSEAGSAVLGSAPSHFPGEVFSRGEAYKTVIADAGAAPDMKAYALYRSIKCYSPAGNNHCGGKDVEKSVRKSWFRTLKTRYANSVWAKSLKYYW
jgi:hypothetical protein